MVMPVAPASRQTRMASMTEGTVPPREFRSVAILLTLTERRAAMRSGQVLLDGVHDLARPGADVLLVLAFEHDAQQRLGPRVADQEAPFAREALLDARHHVGDRRNGGELLTFFDAHVD